MQRLTEELTFCSAPKKRTRTGFIPLNFRLPWRTSALPNEITCFQLSLVPVSNTRAERLPTVLGRTFAICPLSFHEAYSSNGSRHLKYNPEHVTDVCLSCVYKYLRVQWAMDGDLSSWKPAVYRVKARSPITIQQVDCNKNPCSSGTDYVLMAPGKWIPLTRAGGGGWLPFALSRTPSPPAALALLLDP